MIKINSEPRINVADAATPSLCVSLEECSLSDASWVRRERENLSARYDYHLYLLLQSGHILHIRYYHKIHAYV